MKIPNGTTKLGLGSIIRSGNNKITFSTNNGEEVDLLAYGYFFNAYVRTNSLKVSGICSQQYIKSKFFKHPEHAKEIKIKNLNVLIKKNI